MKKTILITLIVIVLSSPCFAEVESEGIFGLENTLWEIQMGRQEYSNYHMGFYDGQVYLGVQSFFAGSESSYINLLFLSIFSYPGEYENYCGIASSLLRFGITSYTNSRSGIKTYYTMDKVNDNWTPPGVE